VSPEIFERWENIIEDVEKTKIPVEFIKKLILKLQGRKQRTINIRSMLNQGFDSEEIEEAVSRKLEEFDSEMIGIEFILDIEGIAETVQPETDKMLKNL
jgi:SOS response regulatory protein OraA/RecX